MSEQDYRILLSETLEDFTYWLDEILLLPNHRKNWARRKAISCLMAIIQLSSELKELEQSKQPPTP